MVVKEFVVTLTCTGDASLVDEAWVQAAIEADAEVLNRARKISSGDRPIEDIVVTLVNEEPL